VRVTGGKYRGREIAAPAGKGTRPVLSRVRQAIFNTLGPHLEDAHVLDPFCGTGGFAIEALSRGARAAVCVDVSAEAVATIRDNLRRLGVAEEVLVYRNDAFAAVRKLSERGRRFGVIAVAPPYWKGLEPKMLALIDEVDLLGPGGILFVQRDAKDRLAAETPPLTRLVRAKTREYGNTAIDYYERRPEGSGSREPV